MPGQPLFTNASTALYKPLLLGNSNGLYPIENLESKLPDGTSKNPETGYFIIPRQQIKELADGVDLYDAVNKKQLDDSRVELDNLNEQISKLNIRDGVLQAEIIAVQTQVSTQSDSIDELKNKLIVIQDDDKLQDDKITELQSQVDQLKNEINNIQSSIGNKYFIRDSTQRKVNVSLFKPNSNEPWNVDEYILYLSQNVDGVTMNITIRDGIYHLYCGNTNADYHFSYIAEPISNYVSQQS